MITRHPCLSFPLLLTRMWDRQTWDSVTAQSKHALSFSTGVFSPTFYVLSFLSVSTTSPTRTTSFIALVGEHNTRNSTKPRLSFPPHRLCQLCSTVIRSTLFTETSRWVQRRLTGSEQKIISEIHPVKLPVELLSTRISVDGVTWKLQTSPKTKNRT